MVIINLRGGELNVLWGIQVSLLGAFELFFASIYYSQFLTAWENHVHRTPTSKDFGRLDAY
jgi:hypothetical protein